MAKITKYYRGRRKKKNVAVIPVAIVVVLLIFVVVSSLDVPRSWIAFFFAIPSDAVVRLTLLSAWKDYRWNQTLISVMVWGFLLSLYMIGFVFFALNLWRIFLLGIPGQVAIFLWFRMFRNSGKERDNGQEGA